MRFGRHVVIGKLAFNEGVVDVISGHGVFTMPFGIHVQPTQHDDGVTGTTLHYQL